MIHRSVITTKILPFTCAAGDVGGHEVSACSPVKDDPVESVVFWKYDSDAGMGLELHVHWTEVTKYLQRKGAHAGDVKAVILRSGQRLHAKANYCSYHSQQAYDAAPLIARGIFRIVGLNSGHILWEVVGVTEWLYSQRDDEARAALLACPWARDNARFHAEMNART